MILREASRDAVPPTLDSVRLELEQQIRQTRFQEYINSLRENHFNGSIIIAIYLSGYLISHEIFLRLNR